MSDTKGFRDLPGRGKHESTPLGSTVFVGLRALDVPLQYTLLTSGAAAILKLFPSLNLPSPPAGFGTPIPSILGLTPYQSLVFSFAVGSSAKHIFWLLYISKEPMYSPSAAMIGLFNAFFNTLNSLAFISSPRLALQTHPNPAQVYLGAAFFITGILVESVAEVQRKHFKDSPKNEGKPYSGGLFGLARNINYGAYTLWRAGYALACGGPIWGLVVGSFFFWDFKNRGVPVLDDYCQKRYGEQWTRVKEKVRYRLFPGIY